MNSANKREKQASCEYIMLSFGFNNAPAAIGVQFSDQFMNLSVFNYTPQPAPLDLCDHSGSQRF